MEALLEDVIRSNEEIMDRVRNQSQGIVVSNSRGVPLESSYDNTTSLGYAKMIGKVLVGIARSCVRDIDPSDNLCFFRVKTKKNEILVAPEEDFTIIVVQA